MDIDNSVSDDIDSTNDYDLIHQNHHKSVKSMIHQEEGTLNLNLNLSLNQLDNQKNLARNKKHLFH